MGISWWSWVGQFFTEEQHLVYTVNQWEVGGKGIPGQETLYTNACRCLEKLQEVFWERQAPSWGWDSVLRKQHSEELGEIPKKIFTFSEYDSISMEAGLQMFGGFCSGLGWGKGIMRIFNLKSNTVSYFTSKEWVCPGITENCNFGHASCCKTTGKSYKLNRGTLFYREGGSWEGFFWRQVHGRRARVQGGDRFSLAEL